MDTPNAEISENAEPVRHSCKSYDPMSPANVEARKHDDRSDGIDWDEIIATTQDDFEAGRFAYNSADYATQEEADAALDAWLQAIVDRVERKNAAVPSCDAAG